MTQFASLTDLDLSNNELELLPMGAGYLPQLRRIDVSNNKVGVGVGGGVGLRREEGRWWQQRRW